MTSDPAAVYWWCGLMLALIGIMLAAWSLFADRSRGRRRCPRCWYDLNAAPKPGLTCSECGHTVRNERRLFKTRRRWRWVGASLLLWMGSAALFLTSKVQNDGWSPLAPTLVLLTVYSNPTWPWHDVATGLLAERVRAKSLRKIEWSMFERINSADPQYANNIQITVPKRWPPDEPIPYSVELAARSVFPPGLDRQGLFDSRRIGLTVSSSVPDSATFEGYVALHSRFREVRSPERRDRLLGPLPPGTHTVRFEIALHVDLAEMKRAQVWKGEHTATIEIAQPSDAELERLAEWFRHSLTLPMGRRELQYARGEDAWERPSDLSDITMAGRLELYWNDKLIRIDEVVITKRLQLVNREVLRRGPLMADFLNPANASWHVRFASDPSVAFKLAHEPRGYWEGTIEFPLIWDEHRRELVGGDSILNSDF